MCCTVVRSSFSHSALSNLSLCLCQNLFFRNLLRLRNEMLLKRLNPFGLTQRLMGLSPPISSTEDCCLDPVDKVQCAELPSWHLPLAADFALSAVS